MKCIHECFDTLQRLLVSSTNRANCCDQSILCLSYPDLKILLSWIDSSKWEALSNLSKLFCFAAREQGTSMYAIATSPFDKWHTIPFAGETVYISKPFPKHKRRFWFFITLVLTCLVKCFSTEKGQRTCESPCFENFSVNATILLGQVTTQSAKKQLELQEKVCACGAWFKYRSLLGFLLILWTEWSTKLLRSGVWTWRVHQEHCNEARTAPQSGSSASTFYYAVLKWSIVTTMGTEMSNIQ